ncbi:MAG TPA: hypothetical protein VGE35_00370 [Candidatus Paceibacterota bacterium]
MDANIPSIHPHPWLEEDVAALEATKNFAEIGEIVKNVALRLPHKVAMISGPMTSGGKGSNAENLAAYQRAMEYVRSRGHFVFDQLPGERALKKHWHAWNAAQTVQPPGYCWELLPGVYGPIFESGQIKTIFFMPDWKSSKGSAWEHEMAEKLGIERVYIPLNWE